jgi:NADH-quinone oxidoreductase subunit N
MAILVILSCLGIFCMLCGLFQINIKTVLGVSVIALATCLGVVAYTWGCDLSYFNDMVFFDRYALGFSAVLIVCTLLLILLSDPFLKNLKGFAPEHFALMFFALTGMVCMVCFEHMSMLFIGIEIMSVSLYVLAGSNKGQLASNEASLKYFLMGAFSTGFILMGMTLIYAETSSFYLQGVSEYLSVTESSTALLPLGISLILMGLLFKVSAVPFHFWTPDVYEGSPDFITAFMSAVAKAASVGAFFRLFATCFSGVGNWAVALSVIAAITITVGSLGAVYQYNIKRLLAYSSVANAGFMLIAIMVAGDGNAAGIIFYAGAYAVAVISAFGVIMVVSNRAGNDNIESFNGLLKTNPLMAFVLTVAMLSLAGIPLTAGFFGKFFILYNSMSAGFVWLAVLGVVNSMVGIYYYFKIIIAVNFKAPDSLEAYDISMVHQVALLGGSALTLVFGVFPQLMYQLLQ